MKSINKYIIEKILINKDTYIKSKPDNWVSIDDFDSADFYDAVEEYGEFEYEDILMATGGEPLYINNKKVLSILIDDYFLKYSYKPANSNFEVERDLDIDNIDDDTLEQLYNYLISNI